MDIEYETSDAAIRVGYLVQCIGRTVRYKGLSRCPVISGKENELRGRTMKPMMNTAEVSKEGNLAYPASRIAVTAACTLCAQRTMSGIS